MKPLLILQFILCFTLVSCNIPKIQSNEDLTRGQIETIVASTEEALTFQVTISPPVSISTQTDTLTPTFSFTSSPLITETPEPGFGSISGNIYGYPYGDLPSLAIVAHEQNPPYHYWYWITGAGNTYYSMDGYVSSGKYQIVAYDSSGHKGGCETIVEVKNGEMVTCDITNWGGGYPPKPAGVP